MTNYDKIRNMTIDEMAELFDDCVFLCNIAGQSSQDGIKQWLESEV